MENLLTLVRDLQSDLPDGVRSQLGDFDWQSRVHSADSSGEQAMVRFYSDGLSLQTKIAVENFIRQSLQALLKEKAAELKVYMERRDKSAPAAQPQSKPQANAGQHQHAHPHSHNHSHAQPPKEGTQNTSGKRAIQGVRRVIAVASGKGGVGKSTVSVNLALALHNQGYKVGILDADIYGPSIPMMLGVQDDPKVNESNKIIPPEKFGLKVMSFGFFAPEESAVIWRGPMVMKALQQFFYDVEWGELDFLVIDLPPGTGDAQLTLVQSLPIAGAVIVTTPQNVALLDAVKGIVMFQKTSVPILGVVENMASFHCPACGAESDIFGHGGAHKVSGRFEVPILGHVPLTGELRQAGDAGEPLTAVNGHPVRISFAEIAEKTIKRLIELEKGV
ncbi:MAG: ATP-binding protein [Proteobacteria bacterium]|nr:ATP-binding protein [Pseudomonadota bacterium]